MPRNIETPLILWICAAVCAHFVFAEGGDEVAKSHDDRSYLYELGTRARSIVHGKDQSIDILTNEDGQPKEDDPEQPKPEAQKDPEPPKPEEQKKPDPQAQKKREEPKKPAESKKDDVKVVKKEDDPLKKLDEQPLQQDNRIAVKQHAQKNQQDNPNAKFIADDANKVEEETAATQTSHDQDDPNPTPGGTRTAGPKDNTGDSDKTKIADSDDHAGEKNKGPGEKGTEFDLQPTAKPIEHPMSAIAMNQPNVQLPRVGGDGRAPSLVDPNTPPPQLAPGAPPTESPEIANSPNGGWTFNPIRPGANLDPSQGVPGTTNQKQPVAQNQPKTKWLGLGGSPGPGQVNLNLTHTGVVAAVGVDQLRKEREADGERRKSEHRGSWTASNFERWRNAIENYVSSVKPGNQTALNSAAVPFATYLNTIHNRIHPIFADNFLGSLDNLPKSHPMNDPHIATRLEIVVSPKDGHIVKLGIVKTSGITAFDIAALDSVQRASPFGPAPGAIVSADGNVYLHWEFHRDEVFACSTMHARPFMLTTPAKTPVEEPQPPGGPNPRVPSQERGAPPPVNVHESKEGALPVRAATAG